VIDPAECIDCGACLPECPVEAIFQDSDLPEQWAHYEEINAAHFGRRDPA
jgi:ferredoxin